MLSEDDLGMLERVKSFVSNTRKDAKPWGQFVAFGKASRPANASQMMGRAGHNLKVQKPAGTSSRGGGIALPEQPPGLM